MKKIVLVLAALSTLVLSGCPKWGTTPGNEMNTLVVHNQDDFGPDDIVFLSIVLVPDECSNDKPLGINLLPEPIPHGGTFTFKNLADGRYYCKAQSDDSAETGYVTLAGGTVTDWYVHSVK